MTFQILKSPILFPRLSGNDAIDRAVLKKNREEWKEYHAMLKEKGIRTIDDELRELGPVKYREKYNL